MLTQDAKPCQRNGEIKKDGICFGVQEYNGFYNNWSYAAQHTLVMRCGGYRLLKHLDCESSEIAMQPDKLAIECFNLKVDKKAKSESRI